MSDLEREDRVQVAHLLLPILRNDGRGVEQALRNNDRIADGERLQRLGQQRTAADRPRERDVVIGKNVVRQSFQRFVELAGCIEKAGLEESLDDIIFCLLNPGALRAERADVLGIVADVGRADDIKRGVLLLRGGEPSTDSPRCD